MWDEGSSHGVLFLSLRPRRAVERLVAWDVCAAFVDMLRCLAYAHAVRQYYLGWAGEFERYTGVAPCGAAEASCRNRAQCKWTAATYSNYAWMCMAAQAVDDAHGDSLWPAGREALRWFMVHVPFPRPPKAKLPTVFPPPDVPRNRLYKTHRAATRAARRYYRTLYGHDGGQRARKDSNKPTS